MKGREALKIIEQMLREGYSKNEIYQELFGKVKFRTDLLQLLAMVPNHEDRLGYKKLNLVLFSLVLFVSIIKIVTALIVISEISFLLLPFVLFVSFVSIFFAVMVWNFRGNIYRFLGLLGIASLLGDLSSLDSLSAYGLYDLFLQILINFIPTIIIIILAYYIGFRVFPHYSFWGFLQEDKLNIDA